MKKSVGAVVVVVLVAVGIVGVVFAGVRRSEKSVGIGNSVVVPVSSQQVAGTDEKINNSQNMVAAVSPEPCLMVLVGAGGLIFFIGKKCRRRRRTV